MITEYMRILAYNQAPMGDREFQSKAGYVIEQLMQNLQIFKALYSYDTLLLSFINL